jgi:hypothetical protein
MRRSKYGGTGAGTADEQFYTLFEQRIKGRFRSTIDLAKGPGSFFPI